MWIKIDPDDYTYAELKVILVFIGEIEEALEMKVTELERMSKEEREKRDREVTR